MTLEEQLRQARIDLERSYDITLEALGDALDLKCGDSNHAKRVTVTVFTIVTARAMELPHERIRVIARGAFLHDIGLIAIPDLILLKPGALTIEEAAIMQEHCIRGYELLRKIPFLSEAAEIAYSHEELYDGTGYPRGLKGEQIPIGARIVAVMNAFDLITSNHRHGAAQSISVAHEKIAKESGRKFDPEVVRILLQMPSVTWESVRQELSLAAKRFTSGF